MKVILEKLWYEPVAAATIGSAVCIALGEVLAGTAGLIVGSVIGVGFFGAARNLVTPVKRVREDKLIADFNRSLVKEANG